jgi:hypothetical protein
MRSTSIACHCRPQARVVQHSDGPLHGCRLSLQDCIDANHRHWTACNRCWTPTRERPLRQTVYSCQHGCVIVTDCACGYRRCS